jgi:hypothetical protein
LTLVYYGLRDAHIRALQLQENGLHHAEQRLDRPRSFWMDDSAKAYE